ncbi:hypothetical protein MKX01_035961 [Papaver californicum]|nr:hypothetical protein MKX01_035961 [Papaver californicum]
MMGRNVEDQIILHPGSKAPMEIATEESLFESIPRSPIQNGRPNSMVVKKAHELIPAHLVAEAISQLHGLDLIRWSGPITPSEMLYVKQYVFTKYPQYYNGLVEEGDNNDNSSNTDPSSIVSEKSPRGLRDSSPSFGSNLPDLEKIQLAPSRLLEMLTTKSSFLGTFISIPEIQARNKVLKHCGLTEDEYLVLFIPSYKEAMMLVGEAYPFFRGNIYMTTISEDIDCIKAFAGYKESKVISAPESWMNLRIKGSQLSQYFRRKCKYTPKGLFSYPVKVNGTTYSLHWVSEAHRNSWHVLLDATGLLVGEDRLNLALHRPDFVLCTLDNTHAQPSKVTCLLVRKKSFDATTSNQISE